MKLYKEHVIMICTLIGCFIVGLYCLMNGSFDTCKTVDGVVPQKIEIIRTIKALANEDVPSDANSEIGE